MKTQLKWEEGEWRRMGKTKEGGRRYAREYEKIERAHKRQRNIHWLEGTWRCLYKTES